MRIYLKLQFVWITILIYRVCNPKCYSIGIVATFFHQHINQLLKTLTELHQNNQNKTKKTETGINETFLRFALQIFITGKLSELIMIY